MAAAKKLKHPVLARILAVFLAILLVALGYFVYVLLDFHRVEDMQELSVVNGTSGKAETGKEYKIVTYNIGFGAYTADYGFFMDGGKESRAWSKDSVVKDIKDVIGVLRHESPDFMILEEVDVDGTRSYHVNEAEMIEKEYTKYDITAGVSYDSPYLFYPILEPHGKNKSVLMTLSYFNIKNSLRRQLPIEDSLMKLVDCDRCYTVNRVEVANGKELVIYGSHLSAYTSDGTIADEQLELLVADMKSEYDKGNYVILGADFNKDLLGGKGEEYFGKPEIEYTWAQPLPVEKLAGTGLSLQAPLDKSNPVPSCRNADGPYHQGQFVVTIDGFITSDNIEVLSTDVIDTGFAYSDHNPVAMKFILK